MTTDRVNLIVQDLNGKTYYTYGSCDRTDIEVYEKMADMAVANWPDNNTAVIKLDKFSLMKFLLREECRIKLGFDYAMTYSRHKTRMLANAAFRETIQEYADKVGIKIEEWFTFIP